ncbi:SDR family oxidoreductase [Candidatus Thioglobus sp.]|jgi:3-oxoacyl-[acyl-carrier protein] reductase|nr:SDR family oxidoreductase [Candidatus Thioglobus sp.]
MLNDKVIFVTGSTRGIGWATARTFAAQGAIVLLNSSSSKEVLEERVSELNREFGTCAQGFLFDVSNPLMVKDAYNKIFKKYRRLDVLVNNAGLYQAGLLPMIQKDGLDRLIDVNIKGVIYNMQYASRLMSKNGSGSIVNLSSIMGTTGAEGNIAYSATKSALIGLTKSAAKELSHQNIRVNAVAPGMIDTEMAKLGMTEDKINDRLKNIGMGRLGKSDEVASVISFLASDASSYVTGQLIGIDGGWIL